MLRDVTTIDTLNPHRGPALLVSLCGARFNGIRETIGDYPNIVLFTDPVTSLTLALPENEVTIGNVWRALRKHRVEHFGLPQSA